MRGVATGVPPVVEVGACVLGGGGGGAVVAVPPVPAFLSSVLLNWKIPWENTMDHWVIVNILSVKIFAVYFVRRRISNRYDCIT